MGSHFEAIVTADIEWRDEKPYSATCNELYVPACLDVFDRRQLFIEGNRLLERWGELKHSSSVPFVIAETGFGAGLNFLITWAAWLQHAPASAKLYYYSSELSPLSLVDLKKCLALWPQLQLFSDQLLANYPTLTPGLHYLSFEQGRINLVLMLGDACQCYKQLLVSGDGAVERQMRSFFVEAWFLDGFISQQHAMTWRDEFFELMALLSTETSSVATVSKTEVVQMQLEQHGFKRSSLGFARNFVVLSRRYRATPWHAATPTPASVNRKAIVIGGGLAGCFMAFALAKRQWQVTIIESDHRVGLGASGNRSAVLYPKLSAFRSPMTELMLAAFLYAVRFYRPLVGHHVEGVLDGILQFACNSREKASMAHMDGWLTAYPTLGRLVTKEEASLLSGVVLGEGALHIPDSGWIDSQALCEYLIQNPLISVRTKTLIDQLTYQSGQWKVNDEQAEIVVVANGHAAGQFEQTSWLPIKKIAGQMTLVKSNAESESLRLPLCGKAHIVQAHAHLHALGATFHLHQHHYSARTADDQQNLLHLQELPIQWDFAPEVVSQWGGVRAAAPDYLPLVGRVAIPSDFFSTYAALATDTRRFIPKLTTHYPGLFLCAGFGSRGLTTIPLCAELLAAQINHEPSFVPRTMLQALSPSRFLYRRLPHGFL